MGRVWAAARVRGVCCEVAEQGHARQGDALGGLRCMVVRAAGVHAQWRALDCASKIGNDNKINQ